MALLGEVGIAPNEQPKIHAHWCRTRGWNALAGSLARSNGPPDAELVLTESPALLRDSMTLKPGWP